MKDQTPRLVRCRLCDAVIRIEEADGGEREDAPLAFLARCPECHAQALYSGADLVDPAGQEAASSQKPAF